MIDEQKQIAEMTKDICKLSKMPPPMIEGLEEWSDVISEYLVKQGWVKLTEDAVIHTQEEYEAEQRATEYWKERAKMWKQAAHEVRDETAKKIVREVKDSMKCFEDDDDGYLLKKCEFECFMREIEKQHGVEVEND